MGKELKKLDPVARDIVSPICKQLSLDSSFDFSTFHRAVRGELRQHPHKRMALSIAMTTRPVEAPVIKKPQPKMIGPSPHIPSYHIMHEEARVMAERRELLRMRRHDLEMGTFIFYC